MIICSAHLTMRFCSTLARALLVRWQYFHISYGTWLTLHEQRNRTMVLIYLDVGRQHVVVGRRVSQTQRLDLFRCRPHL